MQFVPTGQPVMSQELLCPHRRLLSHRWMVFVKLARWVQHRPEGENFSAMDIGKKELLCTFFFFFFFEVAASVSSGCTWPLRRLCVSATVLCLRCPCLMPLKGLRCSSSSGFPPKHFERESERDARWFTAPPPVRLTSRPCFYLFAPSSIVSLLSVFLLFLPLFPSTGKGPRNLHVHHPRVVVLM